MTDIDYVMKIFNIDKETAESMISNGLNIDYMKNGFSEDLSKEIDNMKGNFINTLRNIED